MADKAYSSAGNRAYLRKRGITAVIPVKEDQKKHRRNRGRAGGRPPAFDAGRYKERNTVERCFGKLKQFRAVATRYDKRDYMYQATSTSPRSGSGCETPSLIYGTRPSGVSPQPGEPCLHAELSESGSGRCVRVTRCLPLWTACGGGWPCGRCPDRSLR